MTTDTLFDFVQRGQAAQEAVDKATAESMPPLDIPLEVMRLFDKLALQIAAQGFKRYSADAILHRIRWHMHIERGDRDFKANNNWTATLARDFLARHPEHPNFFETRQSPHKGE